MTLPQSRRAPCPNCNKGPKDTALAITTYEDRTVWQCFRCGHSGYEWHQPYEASGKGRFRKQKEGDHHLFPGTKNDGADSFTKIQKARQILEQSQPAFGSLAHTYLRSRGVELREGTPLRYGVVWHWPSSKRMPAMLSPIVDIRTDELIGLHQTFLSPDGRDKANTELSRLFLGSKKGGAVKLTPDDEVTMGLAVAEGIETAFAGIDAGYPTWALLDAGNLSGFPVLGGIEALTILADHDKAGVEAANTLADRWHQAGREVRIATPKREKQDWNDIVRGIAS